MAHDYAEGLPIAPLLPEVVASLDEQPNLVLEAPPGAGKTTTVPLALLRDASWLGDGLIIVLEPRRVAARGAAARMASLLGQQLGAEVGYRVRYEGKSGRDTRVLVVTEGVLIRRLQSDPTLDGVAAVVFDEFHERSVDADLALALCREAQREIRPDLRLVVMSATLGDALAPAVAALLGGCPTLTSEGRCFPVGVKHVGARPLAMAATGRPREVEEEVAAAVLSVLREVASGDVLVFLPGEREIRGVEARIAEALPAARRAELRVCPLYGALPFEQQQAAIAPDGEGKRRVVLSTNLAESSLTIEGVRVVVDSGLRRTSQYDAAVGMSALVTRPISAAAAEQRTGRAGRVAPGTSYRLWSETEQRSLTPQEEPSIAQADLAPLLLQLGGWGSGVSDDEVNALPWLTPPPAASLARARELLCSVGAIDATTTTAATTLAITAHGAALARLPAHPRLGHALLRALAAGGGDGAALRVACACAAVLDERDMLQGGARRHGADLRLRVAALLEPDAGADVAVAAWRRAKQTMDELRGQVRRMEGRRGGGKGDDEGGEGGEGGEGASADSLAAAFAAEAAKRRVPTSVEDQLAACGALLAGGFVDRIAQRQPGKENVFSLSNGRGASLASATDALASAEYLVCLQLDGGDRRSARIQLAAPLTLEQLRASLGGSGAVAWADETFVAPSDGSVRARRTERLGALVLSQEQLPAPSAEAARPLLLGLLRERGLRRALLGGDAATHPALELVARVKMLRALNATAGWPRWDEASLLAAAEDEAGWLSPALHGATSLKKLSAANLAQLLEQSLPYELQLSLREAAPTTLAVPSGASVRLSYVREGADPLAADGWGGGGDGDGDEAAAEAVAPVLASKLQEWFGAAETPTVGPSRGVTVPVLLHLLTPAGRPCAITSDLASFWAGPYAQVRAELRDKYKRHPWPDDPANAAPTRMTNKALARQKEAQGADGEAGGGGAPTSKKKGGGKAKPAKPKGGGKLPGGKRGPFKRR